MVLLPNPFRADEIGSIAQKRYLHRFSFWYNPAAGLAFANTTAPAAGYSLSYLLSAQYNEYARWGQNSIRLAGTFNQREIDTLILAGTNADTLKGTVKLGSTGVVQLGRKYWRINDPRLTSVVIPYQDRLRVKTHNRAKIYFKNAGDEISGIYRYLPPGQTELQANDQRIFILEFDPVQADGFDMELSGSAPQVLNKLYLGSRKSVQLCSSISAEYRAAGIQNITGIGVVYGHKKETYRHIKAQWKILDDLDRAVLERYIGSVQTVEPHYIMPAAEDYYIPPMYCVLTKQTLENTKRRDRWLWEGSSLEWQEAK